MDVQFPDGTVVSSNIPGIIAVPDGHTLDDAIPMTKKQVEDHLTKVKKDHKIVVDPQVSDLETRVAALEDAIQKLTSKLK